MKFFALLLLFVSSSSWSFVANLDNLSLVCAKVTVPEGELAYMEIMSGIDPFEFFQGTLIPSYEYPLKVSKAAGKLRVVLGNQTFVQSEFFQITILAYNREEIRILVDAVLGKTSVRQFLINIDRPFKVGRLHMRENKDGWSEWKLTADYAGLW